MQLEKIINELKAGGEIKSQASETLAKQIEAAALAISASFKAGGKLLICGNGGSAADAQHIAAEFVGSFKIKRKPLPALALTVNTSVITAIGNDFGFEQIFSRQVEALANHPADLLLAISTSGTSKNILEAVKLAKRKKIKTIGLTKTGSQLASLCDLPIAVPSHDTQRIQESHIAIAHIICGLVEEELF